MSEPTTTQQPTRLTCFGAWVRTEVQPDEEPTELGSRLIEFLTGKYDGPLSADEARCLLDEFTAQERYRLRLTQAVMRCVGELGQLAGEQIRTQQAPYRVSGSYESGFDLGKYTAYADAAQRVQNAINDIAIVVRDAEPEAGGT